MSRVCVVITARPSYARIKSVLRHLSGMPGVQLQIVAAASALVTRYGRVVDQIRADGFDVAEEVKSVLDGDTLADSVRSTGFLTQQLAATFERLSPHVVVTIADRHETLATAIAASYQNIQLCHIQGGEVSGSIDDKVRNAITQLADIHCVATERARTEVWRMSGRKPRVYSTGCPSIDLAKEAQEAGPLPGHNVVVLQHAVTTEQDHAAEQMRETIKALEGVDVLWFWPGEDAGNAAMAKELRLAGLHPTRNLEPRAFLRTLLGAKVLVGNSSVGIRECSYLGIPVVNIGTRQQGREQAGNVIDVPHEADRIAAAVRCQSDRWGPYPSSTLYGDGHAGRRIAAILSGQAVEAVA